MIKDAEVEAAVDWLHSNAKAGAKARAERQYVEEYRKTIKALVMKEHADLPLGAQEREAYADPRYIAHLKAIQEAVYVDEYARFMREVHETKIQAWQTMSANARAVKL